MVFSGPASKGETLRSPYAGYSYRRRKNLSHALGAALLVLLALGHDGRSQAAAEVFGQFVELGVAVNLDGLLGCIANDIAVVAPGKMVLQLSFRFLVEDAVQVTGQLGQKLRTFHWLPSPLGASPIF